MSDCETCGGLGVLRAGDYPPGHDLFGKLVPCPDCGPAAVAGRIRKLSRLTGDLAKCQLERWTPLPGVEGVVSTIVAYLLRKGNGDDRKATGWITLSGPAGTGKTHLLAALVNLYVDAGVPAIYANMTDLLQELRDTYDPESKTTYSQLWKDLTVNARVIALDEFEKWSGTDWAQEQVFSLLNTLYNDLHGHLLLIGTNQDCRGDRFVILPDSKWGVGYIESRMRDGRNLIVTDFWNAGDARPYLRDLGEAL